ncbi:hypothetical protein E5K02_17610 [Hymenobacter metallicola]|uniref:Uncharacterized protein n=1 Tax=Hymenobacter metallicola TaxID=2563114 RepID=A0A4Z0QBR9_9BACT|nr:hypothetical protein E5K02_17610 [Hymenobacter metallicola]
MPATPTSSSRPYVSRRKRSRSSEPSALSTKATLGMLSLLVFTLLASLVIIAVKLTSADPGPGASAAMSPAITQSVVSQ